MKTIILLFIFILPSVFAETLYVQTVKGLLKVEGTKTDEGFVISNKSLSKVKNNSGIIQLNDGHQFNMFEDFSDPNFLNHFFGSGGYLMSNSGGRTGSGGDALVCHDGEGKIESVELWDYAEAMSEEGFKISIGGENLDYREKLEILMDRLRDFNIPKLEEKVAEVISYFESLGDESLPVIERKVRFVEATAHGHRLVINNIKDANMTIETEDGSGCRILQIARQEHEPKLFGALIKIDKVFWSFLSETDKAGLIFHEALLYYAVHERGHVYSDKTRELNALISANLLDHLSEREKRQALVSLEFLSTSNILSSEVSDNLEQKVIIEDTQKIDKTDEVEKERTGNHEVKTDVISLKFLNPYNYVSPIQEKIFEIKDTMLGHDYVSGVLVRDILLIQDDKQIVIKGGTKVVFGKKVFNEDHFYYYPRKVVIVGEYELVDDFFNPVILEGAGTCHLVHFNHEGVVDSSKEYKSLASCE